MLPCSPSCRYAAGMMTRSAGRLLHATQGGETGGRVGRGSRRTREPVRRNNETIHELDGQGNDENLLPTFLAQVGSQGSNQGNGRNQNGDAINDNIQADSITVGDEEDGVSQDLSGYWGYKRFHELARLVPHLVTPKNKRIERMKAIRNGSLKKNTENRGNDGEPSRDRNVRDDNNRTSTGNAFATTANPVRIEYTSTTPKCTNCNLHHSHELPCRACFSCNRLGHLAKDCRVVPRMVNPVNSRNPTAAPGACFKCGGTDHFKAAGPRLNQAQRPGGGRPNQFMAIDGGQGRGNNGNQARGGAFILGSEEAHQDLNIMTGTFTLSNHYATILFDSGADYSFVGVVVVLVLLGS
ncbi:reverse transcriptase domain-containing protein [Tanacetum coccineum]